MYLTMSYLVMCCGAAFTSRRVFGSSIQPAQRSDASLTVSVRIRKPPQSIRIFFLGIFFWFGARMVNAHPPEFLSARIGGARKAMVAHHSSGLNTSEPNHCLQLS